MASFKGRSILLGQPRAGPVNFSFPPGCFASLLTYLPVGDGVLVGDWLAASQLRNLLTLTVKYETAFVEKCLFLYSSLLLAYHWSGFMLERRSVLNTSRVSAAAALYQTALQEKQKLFLQLVLSTTVCVLFRNTAVAVCHVSQNTFILYSPTENASTADFVDCCKNSGVYSS